MQANLEKKNNWRHTNIIIKSILYLEVYEDLMIHLCGALMVKKLSSTTTSKFWVACALTLHNLASPLLMSFSDDESS
jgi:hypothetical protein